MVPPAHQKSYRDEAKDSKNNSDSYFTVIDINEQNFCLLISIVRMSHIIMQILRWIRCWRAKISSRNGYSGLNCLAKNSPSTSSFLSGYSCISDLMSLIVTSAYSINENILSAFQEFFLRKIELRIYGKIDGSNQYRRKKMELILFKSLEVLSLNVDFSMIFLSYDSITQLKHNCSIQSSLH